MGSFALLRFGHTRLLTREDLSTLAFGMLTIRV